MFEKNLTDLVRGIRNNKSNEVLQVSGSTHMSILQLPDDVA